MNFKNTVEIRRDIYKKKKILREIRGVNLNDAPLLVNQFEYNFRTRPSKRFRNFSLSISLSLSSSQVRVDLHVGGCHNLARSTTPLALSVFINYLAGIFADRIETGVERL